MYLRLLQLEIKNFFRSPQFGANLAMKILLGFLIVYFSSIFLGGAFILYFLSKEELRINPLNLLCRYFLYFWVIDLVMRYIMQQMPTQNIKPFLTQNISKSVLVKYTIVKTLFNYLNWIKLLFLIPFVGLLIFDGEMPVVQVLSFFVAILAILYLSNFLNILLNGKDIFFYVLAGVFIVFGALDYFKIIQLTQYSEKIFLSFYQVPFLFVLPIVLMLLAMYFAYSLIKKNFYLDKGLELKKAEGKTENIEFLNRFGVIGTFLNNDIRLLKRSKAAKSALYGSVAFLFYGLLFFNQAYDSDAMKLFAAIFVTGGFMLLFGQKVPAWDSSYYPLMMTNNVPYKKYLEAKWMLLVLGTAVSLMLSTAYLYFGLEFWLTILGAGLYNLGVNSYITLLSGAYYKIPVDLNSKAKSFGGSGNSFNLKVLLLVIPKLLLPMAIYALVKHFAGQIPAVLALGLVGIIGFLMRNFFLDLIVKVYKKEKYSALEAFKKTV